MMVKLLREPLVHFLGAGLLIFVFATLWQISSPSREAIIVTKQDLVRMASVYSSEAGTAPSLVDLQGMINDHIETSVLAAEARRLGLDVGDVVVERRLAQKMRFMIDDLSQVPTISNTKLESWFNQNISDFEIPSLFSFDHVYFRDPNDDRIKPSLASLQNGEEWQRRGDAFMLQRSYGDLPRSEIIRLFGTSFADGISKALPGAWFGPQDSTLGTHLIRVNRIIPSMTPEFSNIRNQVEKKWRSERQRQVNQDAIADLIRHYDVEIESLQ